ncbi:MAG TPA: PRC-barrel domain-containing protein [Microvirga sp.]|nr:PRC-barrel domain-containing protein [Microvirga sp.]
MTPDVIPQGEAQGRAAVAECEQLISLLETSSPAAGVTVEQARGWLTRGDARSCTQARERILAQTGPNRGGGAPGAIAPRADSAQPPGGAPAAAAPAGPAPAGPAQPTAYLRDVPPGVFSAERLKGAEVVGLDITRIGEVEDVLVDRTGRVAAVVIGVGGFLGIGQKSIAVPFESLLLNFEASPTQGPSSSNTGAGLQTQMAPSNNPTSPGVNTTGAVGTPGAGAGASGGTEASAMAQGSYAGSAAGNASGMQVAMGGAPPAAPATVPVTQGELKRVMLRATKAELQNAPEFRRGR